MARPRRASNQRATTVDPVVSATPPAPSAMKTPVITYTCQSRWMNDDPMAPSASTNSEIAMTLRGPQRSASRPTKGPTAPRSKSETAAAPESAPRVQPNSASMGLM